MDAKVQTFQARVLNKQGKPISKGISISLRDRSTGTIHTCTAEKNRFQSLSLKPGLYDVNVQVPGQPAISETILLSRGQQLQRTYASSPTVAKGTIPYRKPMKIEKVELLPTKTRNSLRKRGLRYVENLVWISKSELSVKEKAETLGVSQKDALIILRNAEEALSKDEVERIEQISRKPLAFGELSADEIQKLSGKNKREFIKNRSILKVDELRLLAAQNEPEGVAMTSIDHRPNMSPVKDQMGRGTCTAFAATSLREYFENVSRGRGHQVDLSEQFNYWISRRDNNVGGDGWGTGLAAGNYVEEGGCGEIEWPYNGTFIYQNIAHKPATDQSIINAELYKIGELEELPAKDVQAMKDCLTSGKVAAVSTPVYWANWDGSTGLLSIPPEGATPNGGHGVCIVGWFTDEEAPGGGYFIVKNSWGLDYAPNNPLGPEYRGYNLMPFEYYERFTVDPVTYKDCLNLGDLQWIAEYYRNQNLDGIPDEVDVIHPYETVLLSSVPSTLGDCEQFSAFFSTVDRFEGGIRVFKLEVEGGVRMWVDDRLVINDWRQAPQRTLSGSLYITPGDHVLRIEYFKEAGPAKLELDSSWEYWPVQLYASSDLSGPEHVRFVGTKPDFEWRHVPPMGIDTWEFSGRYRNSIHFEDAEVRFRVLGTGGVRVLVDGAVVLDAWNSGAGEYISDPVNISSGDHVIFLEFHNTSGGERAAFRLDWFEDVWRTEFYNNRELAGEPVLKRTDDSLSFNWGTNAPDPAVGADNFSARFTRTICVPQGFYTFEARTDDGIRVTIDGRRIIDTWYYNQLYLLSAEVFLTDGVHDVCVEYYEGGAKARCSLSWEPTTWTAEYYANTTLSGVPVVQNDNDIHFNWVVDGMDVPGILDDQFSVRWKRSMFLAPGRYRCLLRANGGIRLLVDDYEIINRWGEQSVDMPSVGEFDTIGGNVRFVVEYADLLGQPSCSFDITQTAWLGEYYENRDCSGAPSLYRFDPEINFDWSYSPPSPSLKRDEFSVRWRRTIDLPCGRYRVFTKCNDGIRIFIDGKLIFERWEDHTTPLQSHANIDLVGRVHDMVVEYYDNSQKSMCQVWLHRLL